MRIVIDMQGAQTESRFRGIGRYSLALALAMARNAGGHEIWLALNAAFPESISDIRRVFAGIIPEQRCMAMQRSIRITCRRVPHASMPNSKKPLNLKKLKHPVASHGVFAGRLALNTVKPKIIRSHATKQLRRKRRGIKPEEIKHK